MLTLKKENNIYILSLENKPVNALSIDFISELSSLIDELSNDDNIKGLIVSSNLKHFCAGADLKERASMSTEESKNTVYSIKSLISKILNFPHPTLSLIGGACLGGGLELACSCDFRLCSDTAVFSLPETSLGIIPGAGGTQLLPRIIGITNAKEMIFSGEKIDANKALSYGLVSCVFNKTELLDSGLKLMSKLTSNSSLAINAAKRAIDRGYDADIKTGFNLEFEEYIKTLDSKDRASALKKYSK